MLFILTFSFCLFLLAFLGPGHSVGPRAGLDAAREGQVVQIDLDDLVRLHSGYEGVSSIGCDDDADRHFSNRQSFDLLARRRIQDDRLAPGRNGNEKKG
jgi:hypothetical protein